jgi:N-methylhydantoinase B
MGAYAGHDGVDGRDSTMSNMRNHPVEVVEAEAGVIVHEYGLRTDSGGAGRWRGGTGQMLTFEVLSDGCSVQARGMERLRFAPWGVAGGQPSAKMRCVLNLGREGEQELDKLDEFFLQAGDTMTFMLPGASGYGDPFLREPEAVMHDVQLGFVSRDAAARDYGVVITEDDVVDEAATRKARTARPRDNVRADFDFGPEREAWETVFDDETMCELNRHLYELPRARRTAVRKQIFMQALPDLAVGGGEPFLALFADPGAVRARLKRAMAEAFAPPTL